jgi:hypothetical protein
MLLIAVYRTYPVFAIVLIIQELTMPRDYSSLQHTRHRGEDATSSLLYIRDVVDVDLPCIIDTVDSLL